MTLIQPQDGINPGFSGTPAPDMQPRIVSEPEFRRRMLSLLVTWPQDELATVGSVMGPGRSGAIAAVYVSHMLGVPFIPAGSRAPLHLGRLLLVDTARQSGRTMRKLARRYDTPHAPPPLVIVAFEEPPRVRFWYEAPTPQRYRHERGSK